MNPFQIDTLYLRSNQVQGLEGANSTESLFNFKNLQGKIVLSEGMIIKLIARWNESDSVRDRRYEQTMEAMSDLEKQLSRMDGIMSRMNGHSK